MAVTVFQRPFGFQFGSPVNAAIINSGGLAQVQSTAHGLLNGSLVNVQCNIENYNGFAYVDSATANTFKLNQFFSGGNDAQWIQDCPIVYYSSNPTGAPTSGEHFTGQTNWSCVHLPIVYQLFCTLGPNNLLDASKTVSSYTNDSGYIRLVLSGALSGTVNDLDYVKITGATSPGIDGVYQIMEANSTSDLTISLNYDSIVFGSATVQKYYNNYHIVINVYAGLNASHFWAAKKPYELAGTLRIFPESSKTLAGKNELRFSINEILKSYIKTNNNLLLGTLPNNLDAFVQFYIETIESYDVGTGYSFINFQSAPISDQSDFEGFAVNAKLPFKNIQSGYLSDYLMNNATAKFLTLFALPVMFAGCADKDDCYFDVSFINPLPYNASTLIYLRQAYYKKGVLQSTVDKLISNYDNGVYRAQPDNPSCVNDRVDLSIVTTYGDWIRVHEGTQNYGAFQQTAGSGTWVHDIINEGNQTISLDPAATPYTSRKVYFPFYVPAGTYFIGMGVTSNSTGTINVYFLDAALNVIATGPTPQPLNSGSGGGTMTTTVPIYYVAFDAIVTASSPINGHDITMNFSTTTAIPVKFSETKQVTINCDCNNQNIRLMWLNYLGGYDSWLFTTLKDYLIDIPGTTETKQNIFPDWPKSYGANADTIRKQVSRESTNQIAIHSQNVNEDELQAIEYIKTSPLVQIVKSRTDRRTVIVDKNSFKVYTDSDKLHTIDMVLTFTDDIPSQSV